MAVSTKASHTPIDSPAGYRLGEQIADGGATRIYRATRESDQQPVIIKTLRPDQASRENIAMLLHEAEVLAELAGDNIIALHQQTRIQDLPALVLEDIGGQSLDHLFAHRRPALKACVGVAVAITTALRNVHRAGIIHKDVNPANIIVNPKTSAIRLVDFGIASRYTTEQATMMAATSVPGTPGYMSPEQTGRMNRSVDSRSDFYSLGATLYELVTGRPLFTAESPIEWFHCHIARTPVAPADLNSNIPRVLSDLIMKLLSKTAEQRYQSATGLLHDLRECYRQLNATAAIADFPLARRDIPDHFRIPQRLYGREKQVAELLAAFEAAYDQVSLALVAGRSGIGKSSLINELHKPVTARRGYFISGKFDLVQRDIPYSGLVVALRDLVQQILTESNDRLAYWKGRLEDALGPNGALMTELLPELELIMGPQPPVSPAGATEAEQRFRLTLFNFIRVFSQADHPLVLVLDDLQWADSSTMRLADLLVDQIEGDRLLVVGAYRDNEVTPDHPLLKALQQMQDADVFLTHIDLGPLAVPDICRLLADTLMTSHTEVEPLARIIHQKTEGNPFFVEEFLKDQHSRGNITFDPMQGRWVWDIATLTQQQITDNVAQLMTRKLERLPETSLRLLRLASCAGNRFSLSVLSLIAEMSPAKVAEALHEPILEGLITPIRDAYQLTEVEQSTDAGRITVQFAFNHDRIQETAYNLVDERTRLAAHLEIGRQMLRNLNAADRKDGLFSIVTHLNTASALIDDPEEKRELCRLNLEAGHRARQAASYPIAYSHFQRAILLLGDRPWENDYALALSAFGAAAEAAAHIGDHRALRIFVDSGLANARDLLSRVTFHEIEIGHCITQGELEKAIDIALPLLNKLGHRYNRHPKKFQVVLRFLKFRSRLKTLNLATVKDLPDMTSPEHRAACRIGASIGSAAMFAEPMLLPLLCLKGAEISLDHGHSPETTTAFSIIGMMFAESMNDPDTGVALGRLGIELSDRFNSRRGRAQHLYGSVIQHWKEPLQNTYESLRLGARYCMDNGDFEYAVHASNILEESMFAAGEELSRIENLTSHHLAEFRALHMGAMLYHQDSRLQMLQNLRGLSRNPARLVGEHYNIDEMLPRHQAAKDFALSDQVLARSMYLSYLFGDDTGTHRAQEIAEHMGSTVSGVQGFYGGRWTSFIAVLVYLRSAGNSKGSRQARKLVKGVRKELRAMARRRKTDPFNTPNKHELCKAELLRVEGREFEAHEAFDRSIELSREHGFLSEQALASELCGRMHMNAGRITIAMPYLAKARDLYQRWGAIAKVRQLEQLYPDQAGERRSVTLAGTRAMAMAEVDMTSLMKALRAIADEQIHSRMVAAIIDIAMEFAGAQRGVLALRDGDGRLRIEAEASVDLQETVILQSSPLEQCESVSQATINYVSRTMESVVVADALAVNSGVPGLDREEYILRERVRSILCLPIAIGKGKDRALTGLLYLENNHISNCFTEARIGALEIIAVAAAGRLELSRKAAVDGLTNLFNHDYFQNMLRQELASVARYDREMSLVLLDIDHFKQFNDTWGHQLGDQVLREVADLIKANSRENDTAARYGGEEMVLILPGAGKEEAAMVAERIRKAIERHQVRVDDEILGVTVSLGLVTADASHVDPEKLIRRADKALYKSKANGRNQLTVAA
ncbi:diguanylate cyclase (GGDEF) domain-containing protein [Marinobacter daqiaonensis]|uniref:Diguanylate cyclase (GGDEF) domain-containing protein n=1 Tax=Marinobacter daqiaonensis TaxID=650891 RepID=A0A1I6JPJ0_9GAMM|nr:diguanylate cyclase [Marinobacter daqiaonensis]SFR80886.1 diguanylate cyclase (GGDEF) domain-containing protein [Marinobacter daqiaonensis]